MPILTRTFRVFVSSTFEDLKAERDALQHDAFPKLRKLCEEHGARFQAIDLRWGVRDEAALDQKTIEICLREIERCQHTGVKPNFIVLLGQRYGWRPLPARIAAREFEAVRDGIAVPAERGLVESWYRRDDNAVPPEYLLKPRVGEWVDRARWEEMEARLHGILLDAARAAGLSEQALVKYWASATHQEILQGLGATHEDRRHMFAFCREVPDKDCDHDLAGLRSFLGTQLPAGNLLFYSPGDPERLCRDVERTLRAVIESESAGFESRPALALEMEAHDAFARERALVFGREEVLDTITEYVRAGEERPLVLHGPSGSGKSAVMAQASERARAALPSSVVIRRFIGASPESSSGLTLLRSLSQQIGDAYGTAGELPVDFNSVANVFRERLAWATSDRPLVVFVDALDQLGKDDPASSFAWLGGALPAHCRIVVSTTDLVPALNECRLLKLEGLPQADAATAIDHWLAAVRRLLQPAQRERLLAAFTRCGLPLYLKLAFEEARGWASYLAPGECLLGEGVEGVIDTLLNRLSLEANHGPLLVGRGLGYLAAARYGLTEDEMLDVLSADEDVWRDFAERSHHTPPERRLPVIVWSRLFLDLEPYLAERSAPGGTVASFYHRQLAAEAAGRFLSGEQRRKRHQALAEYFSAQPHWFDAGKSRANARKTVELIHHQLGAEEMSEASATLTDIQFVAAKCSVGLVFDLQSDYAAMIALLPEAGAQSEEQRRSRERMERWTREIIEYSRAAATNRGIPLPEIPPSVEAWKEQRTAAESDGIRQDLTRPDRLRFFAGFVEAECYPLLQFGHRPAFTAQHAFNCAPAGPVHEAATRALAHAQAPLLTRVWSPSAVFNPRPACLRILEGHTDVVWSVDVTADGRRAVSGSHDRTLRVWDLETGACLRTLEQDGGPVRSVCLTPDAGRVVLACQDFALRVWDLLRGRCLCVLKGHTSTSKVAMTPDGRRVVSGSRDRTLRVWEVESGACRVLEGHTDVVVSVAVTPDGRWGVSGGGDRTVRLWDLDSGACVRVMPEDQGFVMGVAVSADGRWAVTGIGGHILRLWDLQTGACLRVLEGHTERVDDVAMAADGRLAVSGSADHTLRVWDLRSGECLRILEGHTDEVRTVAVSADGRRAVSGGLDKDVRIWDLEHGRSLRAKEAHSDFVWSAAVAADGRRAVSGSGRYAGAGGIAGPKDKSVRIWDTKSGSCLHILDGHSDTVRCVALTPDSSLAVSAGDDHTLRVWDTRSGACLHVLQGHTDTVITLAVTRGGRWAVSGSADNMLRLWDIKTGMCLHTLEGHNGPVPGVSVTPDGRFAVSGGADRKLLVWDLQTGRCLHVLKQGGDPIECVAITPDGSRAVSSERTLRVWDVGSGTCLHVLNGREESVEVRPPGTADFAGLLRAARVASLNIWVEGLAVTPDGRRAVSANRDNTLRIWDLENGACLHTLEGHSGLVSSVKVVFRGGCAVSGSWDKTLRVWDLDSGECLGVYATPEEVTSLGVSDSGDAVCAGTPSGQVLVIRFERVAPVSLDP